MAEMGGEQLRDPLLMGRFIFWGKQAENGAVDGYEEDKSRSGSDGRWF